MTNQPEIVERLWNAGGVCPYDEVIDVRSPVEFAEDHIPGAINLPVLSDAERAEVGTLYKQVSPFAARKVGAACVSRNIAGHLQSHFAGKLKDYRPFVYCFRGGLRSSSLAAVLAPIGWRVSVLRGGYKTYREHVRERLAALPQTLSCRLLAGATGSGKTKLLHALALRGLQTLDLEELARHRGSILGQLGPQPSQKYFESRLLSALEHLDASRPVWLEAESNRIGDLYVPPALWRTMRAAGGVEVRMPLGARVRYLLAEYSHFVQDRSALKLKLRQLTGRHGGPRIDAWDAMIDAGDWHEFVASLLALHYDPGYAASLARCFPKVKRVVALEDTGDATVHDFCGRIAAESQAP